MLCVHACVYTLTVMFACVYFICTYLAWVGAHILCGWLGFHWQDREAIAGDRDEGNLSPLFSFISKIVVLGSQPLPIIAETGSDICLSCSWFSSVSAPENSEIRSVVEGSPNPDRPHTVYWVVHTDLSGLVVSLYKCILHKTIWSKTFCKAWLSYNFWSIKYNNFMETVMRSIKK